LGEEGEAPGFSLLAGAEALEGAAAGLELEAALSAGEGEGAGSLVEGEALAGVEDELAVVIGERLEEVFHRAVFFFLEENN